MPHRSEGLHRRDFVRTVSAGLALAPFAASDALAGTLAPPRSRVAVVQTTDRKQGVAAAVKLLDPKGIAGKRVVLKPNFNSADDTPGSTHNDTLAQLVKELQERNARSVTLGESSGPPQTRGVMEKKGTFDLARDLRFEIVDFEQIAEADWVSFTAAHWPNGFALPRLVVNSQYTVSTCCLKTHGFGGVFTMSLKSSVGLTPKPIRGGMHRSPDMRRDDCGAERRLHAVAHRPRRRRRVHRRGAVPRRAEGGQRDDRRRRSASRWTRSGWRC